MAKSTGGHGGPSMSDCSTSPPLRCRSFLVTSTCSRPTGPTRPGSRPRTWSRSPTVPARSCVRPPTGRNRGARLHLSSVDRLSPIEAGGVEAALVVAGRCPSKIVYVLCGGRRFPALPHHRAYRPARAAVEAKTGRGLRRPIAGKASRPADAYPGAWREPTMRRGWGSTAGRWQIRTDAAQRLRRPDANPGTWRVWAVPAGGDQPEPLFP
jgi:hypothetical protein